jgi:hydrogenase maturation protease
MTGRTLVAGVGNIFLGDDGFGVEVVRRLAGRDLPPDVEVADFGIRGVHLAYQLLDGYRLLVLVDALARGEPPGTLTVLEPELPAGNVEPSTAALLDAHGMQPDLVLGLLDVLAAAGAGEGRSVERVLVVGCEPSRVEEDIGLSEPVAAAVDEAVEMVLGLLDGGGEENAQADHLGAPAGRRGTGVHQRTGHRPVLPDPTDVSGRDA